MSHLKAAELAKTAPAAYRGSAGRLLYASAALMALLIMAISVSIWLTLERQENAMLKAQTSNLVMGQLERLMRGLNEYAITEGAKSSGLLIEAATREISKLRGQLDGERIDHSGGVNWEKLRLQVNAFLSIKQISSANDEAMIMLGRLARDVAKLQSILAETEQRQLADAAEAKSLTRLALWVAGSVVLIGTMAIFWVFHRRVTRPLRDSMIAASAYSNGDLTYALSSHNAGEIAPLAASLEAMRNELSRLVAQVSESTHNVAEAATKVRASSDSMNARIQSEASSVEETAVSMRAFAETLQQTSIDTQRAKMLTEESSDSAQKAADVVAKAALVMDGIGGNSRKISEISGMIDELAFQTNLLALNASIESARSGEAGRGFAVLANEIRILAQRSAVASGQIKQLIDAAVESVGSGIEMVHSARDSMGHIVRGNAQVAELISSVATRSTEQAACVEQLKSMVVTLDQGMQANIVQVQQAASVAGRLNEQSDRLRVQVGKFRLAS